MRLLSRSTWSRSHLGTMEEKDGIVARPRRSAPTTPSASWRLGLSEEGVSLSLSRNISRGRNKGRGAGNSGSGRFRCNSSGTGPTARLLEIDKELSQSIHDDIGKFVPPVALENLENLGSGLLWFPLSLLSLIGESLRICLKQRERERERKREKERE